MREVALLSEKNGTIDLSVGWFEGWESRGGQIWKGATATLSYEYESATNKMQSS